MSWIYRLVSPVSDALLKHDFRLFLHHPALLVVAAVAVTQLQDPFSHHSRCCQWLHSCCPQLLSYPPSLCHRSAWHETRPPSASTAYFVDVGIFVTVSTRSPKQRKHVVENVLVPHLIYLFQGALLRQPVSYILKSRMQIKFTLIPPDNKKLSTNVGLV